MGNLLIYYDSITGNVKRFVNKLAIYGGVEIIKLEKNTKVEREAHLITFTTGIGEVNSKTDEFLSYEDNFKKIKTVAVSGNMNWGPYFGLAGDKIKDKYGIDLIMKFELSGTKKDVEKYLKLLGVELNE